MCVSINLGHSKYTDNTFYQDEAKKLKIDMEAQDKLVKQNNAKINSLNKQNEVKYKNLRFHINRIENTDYFLMIFN